MRSARIDSEPIETFSAKKLIFSPGSSAPRA